MQGDSCHDEPGNEEEEQAERAVSEEKDEQEEEVNSAQACLLLLCQCFKDLHFCFFLFKCRWMEQARSNNFIYFC